MAYVEPFVKIDFIGDCFEQNEIWNTGLKLSWDPGIVVPESTVLLDMATDMAGLWSTFFTLSPDSYTMAFSESYRTTEVKASLVGTDGKLVTDSVSYFYPAPIEGSDIGSIPAPQASVVATLRTTKQRGPGSAGRMFLPGISYDITSTGLINETNVNRLASNFADFIQSVNDHTFLSGGDVKVVLTSPVRGGFSDVVSSISIDTKLDTQRRRANNLQGEQNVRTITQ